MKALADARVKNQAKGYGHSLDQLSALCRVRYDLRDAGKAAFRSHIQAR